MHQIQVKYQSQTIETLYYTGAQKLSPLGVHLEQAPQFGPKRSGIVAHSNALNVLLVCQPVKMPRNILMTIIMISITNGSLYTVTHVCSKCFYQRYPVSRSPPACSQSFIIDICQNEFIRNWIQIVYYAIMIQSHNFDKGSPPQKSKTTQRAAFKCYIN